MRITLLGTGGPRPDPGRQGPATLVEAGGLTLLFDAGRGVATQIIRAGVTIDDLDAVFTTHHHFDHIGGLGDLLMAAWNLGRDRPLPVFGPRGTSRIVATLLTDLYAADVQFRMLERETIGKPIEPVTDIVPVRDVEIGTVDLGPVQVEVGRVEHGETAIGDDEWSAVGYRVEADDRVVTVTGDAVAGRDLSRLASGADVLVACCYLAGVEIDSDANRFLTDHVLAGAPQVARIAADAGCRHLVLTHLRQKPPEMIEQMVVEIAQRYDGLVTVGEDLLTVDV